MLETAVLVRAHTGSWVFVGLGEMVPVIVSVGVGVIVGVRVIVAGGVKLGTI